jgi:hypothetical protein
MVTLRNAFRVSLIAVAVCALPRRSQASPAFPDEIARVLDTPCVPECVLCHTTNLGGYGTALTAFAAAMVSTPPKGEKLLAKHTETVALALADLDTMKIDSDKDGISDVDELEQGTNPNGDSVKLCSDIAYGCARVAPRGNPSGVALGALLSAFVWRALRRKAGRR